MRSGRRILACGIGCIFLLLTSLFSLAWAQERGARERGGRIGGGGPAMACFSIAKEEAVNAEGMLTRLGRENLVSAEPIEYFFLKHSPMGTRILEELVPANATPEEAYFALRVPLQLIGLRTEESSYRNRPLLFLLDKKRETLGFAHAQSIALPGGLLPVGVPAFGTRAQLGDASVFYNAPENCAVAYAVVRRNGVLYRDRELTRFFTPVHWALLQLHEEFAEYFNSSDRTQDFLVSVYGLGNHRPWDAWQTFLRLFSGLRTAACLTCMPNFSLSDLAKKTLVVRIGEPMTTRPGTSVERWSRVDDDRDPHLIIQICHSRGMTHLSPFFEINWDRSRCVPMSRKPLAKGAYPVDVHLDGAGIAKVVHDFNRGENYDDLLLRLSFRSGSSGFIRTASLVPLKAIAADLATEAPVLFRFESGQLTDSNWMMVSRTFLFWLNQGQEQRQGSIVDIYLDEFRTI